MMKKGPAAVLACYILWGLLPVYWKLLADVPSLYVLSSRALWSMLLCALVLTLVHGWGEVRRVFRNPEQRRRLLTAGVLIYVNWGSYIWSVNSGHVLDASLAYYMNPILTILLGTLIFHEKLTGLQWFSVAVTLAGIGTAVVRYGQFPWLAVIIGGTFALYGASKKSVHVEAQTSIFVETLTLLPLALVFLLWSDARGTGAAGVLHGWQWLLLPGAGVATTIPLMLYAKGIQTTPLSLSGILMYVNPTIQLLLGVLLFREKFTATHAILFGFVWSGLVLYLIAGMLQKQKEKKPCV